MDNGLLFAAAMTSLAATDTTSAISDRFERSSARLARAAAVFAAVVGSLVLYGWATGSMRLKRIATSFVEIAPNTAIGLVLAAVALAAVASKAPERRYVRLIGRVAAILSGLIGLEAIFEELTSIDLGLDRLLLGGAECGGHPECGRPSFIAAGALVTLAVATLAIDVETKRGLRPAQVLLGAVALSALVTVAGYVYDVTPLYGLPGRTDLALHAAVALFVLAIGLLFARPRVGVMAVIGRSDVAGTVARRFLAALALAPLLGLAFLVGQHVGLYSVHLSAAFISITGLTMAVVLVLGSLRSFRRVEDAFHVSERRYRALVDQAADGIFLADESARYREVNPALCQMLHYTRDELLDRKFSDVVLESEMPKLEQLLALHTGDAHVTRWVLRAKDGALVPVEASMKRAGGDHWLGILRDISERTRAELALASAYEREKGLRRRFELASIASRAVSAAVAAMPQTGINAVLRTIAEQARNATDADYAALGIGKAGSKRFEPWIVIGFADDAIAAIGQPPRLVGVLGTVAHGRIVRSPNLADEPEFRGLPPAHPPIGSFLGAPVQFDGESVGNLYLGKKPGAPPFTSEDERVVAILATRAAMALHTARLYDREAQAHARLRALVDHMPVGAMFTNGRAAATRNQFLESLAGGASHLDLRTPSGEPLAPTEQPLEQALRTGVPVAPRELAIRTCEGRLVPVMVNAAPIVEERGRNAGAVAVFHDISATKELDRMREEWISVVAHELRQPLNTILLHAQLIRELPSPSPHDPGERIRAAGRRLDRMIGDLTDVSRIEARRLRLERLSMDLRALIDGAVDRSIAHEQREVRISENGPPQPVFIDPGRIEQVVANLLVNAVKYGSADTEVKIDLTWRDEEVEVSISNYGPGIAEDDLRSVFSRFERTHRAHASGISGLGLGLYICRGLVEAHGGRIWAESTPGALTTFHFTLPHGGDR
jgi:PAS domain S-box-containing protein